MFLGFEHKCTEKPGSLQAFALHCRFAFFPQLVNVDLTGLSGVSVTGSILALDQYKYFCLREFTAAKQSTST